MCPSIKAFLIHKKLTATVTGGFSLTLSRSRRDFHLFFEGRDQPFKPKLDINTSLQLATKPKLKCIDTFLRKEVRTWQNAHTSKTCPH